MRTQAGIAVWLLTGYLGAGKTTLLGRWLREPGLARAALVINEIGEVGLDDRLLSGALDSASLLADACICCTGLPGLEQALSDLWWDALHRRRPAFDAVLIETTGLADPGPVMQALASDPFLRQRYVLAGVVTVVSATTAWTELAAHPEARAQVALADLLVVSKVDRADPAALLQDLRAQRADLDLLCSAQASLGWNEVQASVRARRVAADSARQSAPGSHDHAPGHAHAQACFLPCPPGLDREGLSRWASAQRQPGLQRLKGVLQSADGALYVAQWALGDEAVTLVGFEGSAPRLGLTCIA